MLHLITFVDIMQVKSIGYQVSSEEDSFSYLYQYLNEHSFSNVFILCDKNTQKHCLPVLLKKLKALQQAKVLAINAGEAYKTLETVNQSWNFLLNNKADKSALLISLGGGVVCDLGGFIASTFKRGIPFIHIPTTLLAMADASIGGKNGIDFKGYKNLIGTITQPKGIFIYEGFLKTLPKQQIKNGFAEIIKAALIGDKKLWHTFLSLNKLPETRLGSFIHDSVLVKNKIVLKDPNEKNIRQVLNFGHTIGHAIETYYLPKKNNLLHGEAIVMGMCVELCLGKILNLTSAKAAMEAFLFFKENYVLYPFPKKEVEAFLKLMQHDKKNKNGAYNFALLKKIGKPLINIPASDKEVKEAFTLYNNLLV
jgi:3-dehydroquinate synthase